MSAVRAKAAVAPETPPPTVPVPACWAIEEKFDGNRVRQMIDPPRDATIIAKKSGNAVHFANGDETRLVARADKLLKNERALRPGRVSVLRHLPTPPELHDMKWIGKLDLAKPADVLASFDGAFNYVGEDPKAGTGGLRIPQLGAIHAILGYWTTSNTLPATVVMPTGTGKTEAMLGLLVSERPTCLLVLVPSDALRDQIATKFESLGLLQDLGVVSRSAMRPVVGRVGHKFTTPAQAGAFAARCNVIVATPQALNASSQAVRAGLFAKCSHLFVDEAHHVAAATWKEIRDAFADRNIVQFTATPFREDGRRMGGRIVYAFPLREAQKQGYFSHINYHSIVDFENQDRAIAVKAVEVLRADLAKKHDHLIMARVGRISRAPEVLALYRELAPDLHPVLLHSGVSATERKASLAGLASRASRIIVCVDMLGEGFDLPSLKIAAIHDAHRSLGVTLQFVGRFVRVAGSIGDASVVVARPDSDYDDNLRRLYAEDADWNQIVRKLSEAAVGAEEEVTEFEAQFNEIPEQVSLANLIPKMSTVVYRTEAEDWNPDGITSVFPEELLLTVPVPVNPTDHVAWFVTEINAQVTWGDIRTVQDLTHDLYIVYWDANKKLLYINSSNKESLHEGLAKAICGNNVELLKGEGVYRVMAQVNRLVPTNMGVLDYRNRSRRFSMHVGADVGEAFPTAEAQTKTKTNIFAYGFEGGSRVSVGASLKGRIWSYRTATTIKSWMDWCDHVGRKLTDESISLDEVMKHFIRPKDLKERPPLVALALEWPYEVFLNTSDEVKIEIGETSWPLVDADLQVTTFSAAGPIPFKVVTPDGSAAYEAAVTDKGVIYRAVGSEANVLLRETRTPLSTWLSRHGLTIHLEDDASITPNGFLLKPDRELPPFDLKQITAIEWKGINIRKESQGKDKAADSVQARVIKHVEGLADWQLIIDDDGAGEIADIVAIRADDKNLHVLLVHCKYSSADAPGHRVEDLYEVCGQANKSVKWKRNTGVFFRNLIRREKKRLKTRGRSGFEKGNAQALSELADRARMLVPHFAIILAQPGVKKSGISKEQLDLLGSTEIYVRETALAPLELICSS